MSIYRASSSRTVPETRTRTRSSRGQLPGIDSSRRWLLVTSALHMPRSMAVFGKLGWNVAPMPVDYQTGRTIPLWHYSISRGAADWQTAMHEILGLVAYWATGRL